MKLPTPRASSAPVLCVTGPLGLVTGDPAGVATYGGASVAALPEDVVTPPPPDEGVATLVLPVVLPVGTGAAAGPEDPDALGIAG